MKTNLLSLTHRRYNPLTDEWILVSPGRLERPWQGKVEKKSGVNLPQYDPSCYLCPGNKRANGSKNPRYDSTFVFDNDFSALSHDTTEFRFSEISFGGNGNLICAEGERGICRVMCYSPRHDITLAEMSENAIAAVVEKWKNEYMSLGNLEDVNYVQIFENKGELMGCSNPHPHCQIWAESSIPVEAVKEGRQQKIYREKSRGRCLICDYISHELKKKERTVIENDSFAVVVPFWAVWPFEVMLAPKEHISGLNEMSNREIQNFASALKRIAGRYDNLFEVSFPYSAGIHQAPTDKMVHNEWHLHMHFYPPLLRSAAVKKFMVGYEMLANPQRDLTAETAAQRLREMPDMHWKNK